ncbi:hypothetical protein POUND7_002100 [Theobroma cacao]
MVRFRSQSHSLTLLCQILSPLLLLIFMIIIHPSYADEPDEPLRGKDLVNEVCNHTSDYKFCADTLLPSAASAPSATAGEIANTALRFAQVKATDARVLIASLLLKNSSSSTGRRLLQRCQLDNNKTIRELSSANDDLNSDSIDSMVEDLNNAANATRSCQDTIRETPFSSALDNKNIEVIKLCEIGVVSTKFFTIDDFT